MPSKRILALGAVRVRGTAGRVSIAGRIAAQHVVVNGILQHWPASMHFVKAPGHRRCHGADLPQLQPQ